MYCCKNSPDKVFFWPDTATICHVLTAGIYFNELADIIYVNNIHNTQWAKMQPGALIYWSYC
jgi:hypothetical protein